MCLVSFKARLLGANQLNQLMTCDPINHFTTQKSNVVDKVKYSVRGGTEMISARPILIF